MKLRRMEDSVRWFVLRFQPEAYNFEDYLVVCLNVCALAQKQHTIICPRKQQCSSHSIRNVTILGIYATSYKIYYVNTGGWLFFLLPASLNSTMEREKERNFICREMPFGITI